MEREFRKCPKCQSDSEQISRFTLSSGEKDMTEDVWVVLKCKKCKYEFRIHLYHFPGTIKDK